MAGPLPTGTALRRNKPTIPTSELPVTGRTSPVPDPPMTYHFGPAAQDWWDWAWRTPQACGWDDGQLFVVAGRAQIEDDIAASVDDPKHSLALKKERRELDNKLGMTPKGLADLRWKIVAAEESKVAGSPTRPKGRKRSLSVVPDSAAG